MLWGNKKVIAIGGGKGGVGKSTLTANLGVALAKRGKRVVVVDADIGAANLHTIIGVRYPDKTLGDFIDKREPDLGHALIDTAYPGLRLLSSASDLLGIASPTYADRQRLFRALTHLDTDVIIFDIAAGTHQRATDFFALAPIEILTIEPVPTSLENAFSFLKNLLVRTLMRKFYHDTRMTDFIQSSIDPRTAGKTVRFSELLAKLEEMEPVKIGEYRQQFMDGGTTIGIIANAVTSPAQSAVAEKFALIVKQYLSLDVKVLGTLPYEAGMNTAITERVPFIAKYPDSGYAKSMEGIAGELL